MIAIKIGTFRIGVPTMVLLYLNMVLAAAILVKSLRSEGDPYADFILGGGYVLPSLLILFSAVTLHGLLFKRSNLITFGAFGAFLLWAVDLIFWMIQGSLFFDPVTSVMALPMMLFFAFVHIKYSLLQEYGKEHHDEF